MKKLLLSLFVLFLVSTLFAQQNQQNSRLEIYTANGETSNDLFLLKKAMPDDTLAEKALKAANSTFIKESALLFEYVQNYLYRLGEINSPEHPKLAISNRQGCFGVMGFVLDSSGIKKEKPLSGYVDLHKQMFSKEYRHLQSITQLFPHEMGHVIQMYLCTDHKNFEPSSNSPNIHYFNIVTSYNTAFSEGFAEHFENVSRKLEPSSDVKEGIYKDIEAKKKALPRFVDGFNRDFKLPLRIGFYRAITPLWYQQLENLKRYELVENGQIKYVNTTLPISNTANAILYRNTGVSQNKSELRNAAQIASTEGAISAFFSGVVLSDLGQNYLPKEFYNDFLIKVNDRLDIAKQVSPLDNEYLKIFKVMHRYVKTNSTQRGQIFDFVDGYCKEYPNEASEVMSILNETTGVSAIPQLLPEIWVLRNAFDYDYWVMAQFGLTVPYYTFNLNTADSLDLSVFKNIPAKDISKILEYRENKNGFASINEIKSIPNISELSKSTLINNLYDEKKVPDYSGHPNFSSLMYLPLLHIVLISLIWMILVIPVYLYLVKYLEFSTKQKLIRIIFQFIKLILISLLAIVCLVMFHYSLLVFLAVGIVILGIKLIILRKKPASLRVSLTITSLIILIVMYSIL